MILKIGWDEELECRHFRFLVKVQSLTFFIFPPFVFANLLLPSFPGSDEFLHLAPVRANDLLQQRALSARDDWVPPAPKFAPRFKSMS